MSTASSNWFLADDFSGALEVGAAWKKHGIPIDIVFDLPVREDGDAVVGYSSETRNASCEEAEEGLTQALEEVGNDRLCYKKIDSTMRGPVGAELRVIRDAYPDRPILFSPANASVGREVREGKLYVEDKPVSESAFRHDPVWPIAEDRIAKIIIDTGGPDALAVPVGSDREESANRLRKAWENSPIAVVDSSTQAELEEWSMVAHEVSNDFLGCGSGGLANALVSTGVLSDLKAISGDSYSGPGKVLIVVGSMHPTSRDQIDCVTESTRLPVEWLSIEKEGSQEWRQNALMQQGALILSTELPSVDKPLGFKEVHKHSEQLAHIASELFSDGLVDTLFLTGGETARTVVDQLNGFKLQIQDEFAPGVSVSEFTSGDGRSLRLIVKPGGFGERDLLAQILDEYAKLRPPLNAE